MHLCLCCGGGVLLYKPADMGPVCSKVACPMACGHHYSRISTSEPRKGPKSTHQRSRPQALLNISISEGVILIDWGTKHRKRQSCSPGTVPASVSQGTGRGGQRHSCTSQVASTSCHAQVSPQTPLSRPKCCLGCHKEKPQGSAAYTQLEQKIPRAHSFFLGWLPTRQEPHPLGDKSAPLGAAKRHC